MLNPRWYKVLRDIWRNKTRTLLVVLSIAVGCFAVGTVAHMQVIVSQDLVESYALVNPAQIVIYTEEGFDKEFVLTIQEALDIQAIEGRRSAVLRFKLNSDDEWHPIRIFALANYEQISVNQVKPEQVFEPDPDSWPAPEVWPPPERELILERTSLLLATLGLGRKAQQGDSLLIETPTGKQREIPMTGLAYDFSQTPATFAGMAYGFIDFNTLEWLGLPSNFNELHIIVDSNIDDWERLKQNSRSIQERIEKAGYTVTRVEVPEPGKLPLDSLFQAVTLILGAMGVFALFLAIFLVINTISALLTQQVRQIGVMKSIGATPPQLMAMYLGMVALFGILSLIVAIPSAAYFAFEAISFMAYFINFNLGELTIEPQVVILQIGVSLVVPLLAAIYPVIAGVRITVREAISNYGLSNDDFGSGFIDRLIDSIRGLPRPLLLSLRNTVRRKMRLWLTLTTLTLAGAVVISAISVRASMDTTLEDALAYWQFDVQVQFIRPYRIRHIENELAGIPGIVSIEGWGSGGTYRIRPDSSESDTFSISAPPAETQMLNPQLIAGRWLKPEDQNQLIINNYLWSLETDIQIGDEIILKLDGRETPWQVVGVVKTVGDVPIAYANYPYFATAIREVGTAGSIQILLDEHGADYQTTVAQEVEKRLEAAGIRISNKLTNTEQREQSSTLFDIIASQLIIMAVLMVIVGGLGLAGTMSLNVLERIREIGVMRAIGASDGAILQIFMVEGMFIGLLSWVFGFVLALPLGAVLSNVVGVQFLNAPLTYTFSFSGALIWLIAVLGLSAFATYFPANQATQLSVQEVLSYE